MRRLLLLVPYVVRHQGVALDELARTFDVSREQVERDLELLFLTGLPPYGPGDLIEAQWEGGRVTIRMADHLAHPIRLTRTEALSLYLRAAELLDAPGLEEADDLRSALGKLEQGLGPETLGSLTVEVGARAGGEAAHLSSIREAVERRERVEVDHYSAARDEVTTRRIDPEHVFSTLGNWYVVAWCHRVDGERLFRMDRMRDVRPTGERFEPRGLPGAGRELYTRTEEDIPVRLRLGPAARWVAEYYEVDEATEEDGSLEVTLPTSDLAWMAKLILRLGGTAEILEPPELVELARRTTEETLARYGR